MNTRALAQVPVVQRSSRSNSTVEARLQPIRDVRLPIACAVEITHRGERLSAVTQDLSRGGLFVRTGTLLPRGSVVQVMLQTPDGSSLRLTTRVAHAISDKEARALGRQPGLGLELIGTDSATLRRLENLVSQLEAAKPDPAQPKGATVRVLVCDANSALLERLSMELDRAGFAVETASNGAEAMARAFRRKPDLILTALKMPVVDGWALLRMLFAEPSLASVPVAVMEDDRSDLLRLRAFRLGVKDFIPKPFTVDELGIRLRRLLPERTLTQLCGAPLLKGNLAGLGVGTLLSLLEYERKSGILDVTSGRTQASLLIASGVIVRVLITGRDDEELSAEEKLRKVLDWKQGTFRFQAGDVERPASGGISVTQLLLEHARLSDEAARF